MNAIFWLPNLLSSMASSDSARNNASSEALARDFHSVIIRLSGGKKVFAFLIASGDGERCQPGVPPGLVNNLSSPEKGAQDEELTIKQTRELVNKTFEPKASVK